SIGVRCFSNLTRAARSSLPPYTTLFRSGRGDGLRGRPAVAGPIPPGTPGPRPAAHLHQGDRPAGTGDDHPPGAAAGAPGHLPLPDRKSTRLNSSHVKISYAVFGLKKKTA